MQNIGVCNINTNNKIIYYILRTKSPLFFCLLWMLKNFLYYRKICKEGEHLNGIINLLSNNGYIIVNKMAIKKIGIHEAIILGELCSEYMHWEKSGRLEENYFYSTRENIEENTGLSAYQQREPMRRLIDGGIISEKSKGMPLQKWYSINEELLYKILCTDAGFTTSRKETAQQDVKKLDNKMSRNLTTRCEETAQHDVKKLDINNNNINNKNNNNKKNNNNIYVSEQKIKYKDKVFLTKTQYNELTQKYGRTKIDNLITRLDLYKKSTGKNYKDDYATILLWINTDDKKNEADFKEDSDWMNDLKVKFGEHLEGLYANYEHFCK